ncbi:hypothetical protein D9M68_217980 [compost metagenome]
MSEKQPTKGRVIAFRVSEMEFAEHADSLTASGLTLSAYARRIWLEGDVKITPASKNQERLVFLYNKSSNNLNQLAHRINEARRGEIISEKLYLKLANHLVAIRELLLSGVKDAD